MGRKLSRRALIMGGVAAGVALVGGVGVGEYTEVLPGGVQLHRLLGLTGGTGSVPDVPPATVTTHQVHSAARGRTVNLITMVPAGADPRDLPVCLVLHGRDNDAQGMVTLGLPQFLTAAVRAGMPPVALVAVDGGDSYWVARTPADDPQRMLTAELPGWLTERGFATGVPTTVLAISMGCFGALVYARGRVGTNPLRAMALLSPALFQNWTDANGVHAFASAAQWAEFEPLQHLGQLPSTLPIGIWCGREDPFYPAATQLAAGVRPVVASFPHGRHDDDFWRRMLPAAVPFAGTR